MKIKARDVYTGANAMVKMVNSELPIQKAYKLSIIYNKFVEVSNIIENKRLSIMKKYGKEEPGIGTYVIPKEDILSEARANDEFENYLDEEIDIDIDYIDIKDLDNISLTISEMRGITWLIKNK